MCLASLAHFLCGIVMCASRFCIICSCARCLVRRCGSVLSARLCSCMDIAVLKEQLALCHITVSRARGADYIRVPGPDVLRSLLSDDGFDTDVLESFAAMRDGQYCLVRWVEPADGVCVCGDAACRLFNVTWQGKHPVSSVCGRLLNDAARYYVCFFYRRVSLILVCCRLSCNTV